MKTHTKSQRAKRGLVRTLVFFLASLLAASMLSAQPPQNPAQNLENIPAGALIIPMDNVNQGNAAGTTFNLRAYGLANRLLQLEIPVKWAIRSGKAKDGTDFTANVSRIAGTLGSGGPADVVFSGGPFVIPREFDTATLREEIATFNSNPATAVTVYKTNADMTIDVRYTLTHKPRIAIGPDGGNFGSGVHQAVFNAAGITEYTSDVTQILVPGACYTLATQAHSTNPGFVEEYRTFVENGGNLQLQCASVGTFENHPSGHFQTDAGYSLFTSNSPANEINSNAFAFPVGAMPFNQFIGLLADQDGAVTEFAYAPGSAARNNNTVSVVNTGANGDKFVATASQIGGPIGGVVFTLGGHNYARADDAGETDSALAMLNGQRMLLNTVFVPARTICIPGDLAVIGYKSVRRYPMPRPANEPPLLGGDTVEWTIDYFNRSQAHQTNFQIRDIIGAINGGLIWVPGQNGIQLYNSADPNAPLTAATLNPNFDGVGNDASADLLNPGAVLPVGGRIRVTVRTRLDPTASYPRSFFNQTIARSDFIVPNDFTRSDAVDATNFALFDSDPPAATSVTQTQNGPIIDPTRVFAPTAADASAEGRVLTEGGAGIMNALVTFTNATTGVAKAVRTNAMGVFRVDGLETGELYLVTLSHRRYRFPTEPLTMTLDDNVTGLTFTGRTAQITAAAAKRRR